MKSPIGWFGGKARLTPKLVKLIPEHHTYCEVFGGAASLLFAKEPSPVEVYNDIDSNVVNFFRVLRDPVLFPQFYNKACFTPYSREEWNYCKDHIDAEEDAVERARMFFCLIKYGFSGRFKSGFGAQATASSGGMAKNANSYHTTISSLHKVSERLMRVQIESKDFRSLIPQYDTENTFFYLDPPYVPETRKAGKYACEMTLDDHHDLIDMLANIKGKVMLSGYATELYDSLGWDKQEFEVKSSAIGRIRTLDLSKINQNRTEVLWQNY